MARPNPLDLTVCPPPDVMAFTVDVDDCAKTENLYNLSAYEAVLRPGMAVMPVNLFEFIRVLRLRDYFTVAASCPMHHTLRCARSHYPSHFSAFLF